MSKLTSNFSLKYYWPGKMISALCLISFLLLTTAFGQNPEQAEAPSPAAKVPNAGKASLPDKVGESWRATEPSHALSAAQLSAVPDKDVYAEYSLQTLKTRGYSNGKAKLTVELFQTRFPSEAYGLFTFIRSSSSEKQKAFYTGNLLAVISGDQEERAINAFVDALKMSLASDEEDLPSLPFNLPEERKFKNTDKYVIGPVALGRIEEFADLKEVINFTGGTHAVAANYQNSNGMMSLIIFEYHTPQLATDGYALVQTYLQALSEQEKSARLLRRIGNYVVIATNVQETSGAESVISQIKYSPKIYWEGKKITDLPIQLRPTDPLVMEEASQTANMIVRTFYWIGVMILGAISIGFAVGSSFFYWRRHQRRKLGLDDVFSDAGGTVRLNLDKYLLEPKDYLIKGISEGKKPEGK